MAIFPHWRQYQEDVASYFRQLGFDAKTDVALKGVRTSHDVDVVVRSKHVGFPLFWLIECKDWKSAVPKGHVLQLRTIVEDVGADRGIMMSESSFQSGAVEAAYRSNIQLSSLAQLKLISADAMESQKLFHLYARYGAAKELFWEIPKCARIAHLLRTDAFRDNEVPGLAILNFADEVLAKAHRSAYPISAVLLNGMETFNNNSEVLTKLESLMGSLEARLTWCMTERHNWPKDEDEAYEQAFAAMNTSLGRP